MSNCSSAASRSLKYQYLFLSPQPHPILYKRESRAHLPYYDIQSPKTRQANDPPLFQHHVTPLRVHAILSLSLMTQAFVNPSSFKYRFISSPLGLDLSNPANFHGCSITHHISKHIIKLPKHHTFPTHPALFPSTSHVTAGLTISNASILTSTTCISFGSLTFSFPIAASNSAHVLARW